MSRATAAPPVMRPSASRTGKHRDRQLNAFPAFAKPFGLVAEDCFSADDSIDQSQWPLRTIGAATVAKPADRRFRGGIAGKPLRAGVPAQDGAVQANADDGVVGRVHNGGQVEEIAVGIVRVLRGWSVRPARANRAQRILGLLQPAPEFLHFERQFLLAHLFRSCIILLPDMTLYKTSRRYNNRFGRMVS